MSPIALRSSIPLTAFHIKMLAAILMIVDHVGYVLEDEWLRIIGRFSFPLFAWALAQGAKHTKNWQRYERRLLVLAIATQPIHALFVGHLFPLNSVFQLWLGLVLFRLMNEHQMTPLLGIAIIGVATLFFEYGYYGIALVYLISSYPLLLPKFSRSLGLWANIILWIVAFVTLHFYYATSYPLQLFALPTIVLIPFLSTISERGPRARWFYWFYPVHFVPLILLKGFQWLTN